MDEVILRTNSLGVLLGLKSETIFRGENHEIYSLAIPDYQRIYCWEEKNVIKLLEDIVQFTNSEYHLGSIILHKINTSNSTHYDIVDGQQRLVTLSLLLSQLNINEEISLLKESFMSDEAQKYIAYNKYLIRNFIEKDSRFKANILIIINKIKFSVLIIQEGSLDLAYTFFSNQNSRGKALSDFDLLKAHHLRYVLFEDQAKHLAHNWDSLLRQSDNEDNKINLGRTFGTYLFRLRKWMRKNVWSNDEKYKVKTEFEASSVISFIPPFGEQFHFYEKIQGGPHFFAYADQFINKFVEFSKTNEYQLLQSHLSNENHWWYRDIIEAFLFAYYLKFGNSYFPEALECITLFVSNHRYNIGRTNLKAVLKLGGDSEIVMMIDQATSPTFFFAEIKNQLKYFYTPANLEGTRKKFQRNVEKLRVKNDILINFKA